MDTRHLLFIASWQASLVNMLRTACTPDDHFIIIYKEMWESVYPTLMYINYDLDYGYSADRNIYLYGTEKNIKNLQVLHDAYAIVTSALTS